MTDIQIKSNHSRVRLVAENDHPSLLWQAHARDPMQVAVAKVDVECRMNQRVIRDRPLRLEQATQVNNQLHLTLMSIAYGLRMKLQISLDDASGGLRVQLPMAELEELDSDVYRLHTVHILPGLLEVPREGTGLLSLSSGLEFSPVGQPVMDDSFLIYGEQPRWELLPVLPAAAVGNHKTGTAVLATRCPYDTLLRVRTDGNGGAWIDAGFSLRQAWTDPVDHEDRELRYQLFDATPDLLHGAAGVMRRYITDELGKPSLAQRAKESPEVAQMLKAMTMKLFFGIQKHERDKNHPGPPGAPRYLDTMHFDEAAHKLAELKAIGIEHAMTQSVGFIDRGHDGVYPSHTSINQIAGGPAAFTQMLQAGHDLGYAMNIHDNYNEAYRCSADFDETQLYVDEYGEHLRRGRWGGGQSYLVDMARLPESRVEHALEEVKALGLTGMHYVDAVANPLYRNYDPAHRAPRSHHAKGIQRILKASRKTFGSVGIECGFLYGIIETDSFCMPGTHRSCHRYATHWPIAQLKIRRVPLLNLVCSGLWSIETGINLSWTSVAESLMFGKHPRTEWAVRPGYSSALKLDDTVMHQLKAFYDLSLVQLGRLQTQQIMRWEQLGPDHERTHFEDGTTIELDYAAGRLSVDGQTIEQPSPLCHQQTT